MPRFAPQPWWGEVGTCIYRGSPHVVTIDFDFDASAMDFTAEVRATRGGPSSTGTLLGTYTVAASTSGGETTVTLTLSAATTAAIAPSSAVWDLVEATDGVVITGAVEITGSVTA